MKKAYKIYFFLLKARIEESILLESGNSTLLKLVVGYGGKKQPYMVYNFMT